MSFKKLFVAVASYVTLITLAIASTAQAFTEVESDGIFTANQDLKDLLWTEAEIIRELKNYIQQEESRLLQLKDYVARYEDIYTQAATDVEHYVENPLNSFILIKKLTSDWRLVKDLISSTSTAERFLANLTDNSQASYSLKWPSDDDLNGAAAALTRLQDTYKLDVGDMARGQLMGVTTGSTLSAHDCFEMGRQSYNSGDAVHTVQWMKQALKRLDEEGRKTVDKVDVLEYLAFTYYSQGKLRLALRYTDELLKLDPEHPRATGNKVYYEDSLKNQKDEEKRKGEDGFDDEVDADVTVAEQGVDARDEEQEAYKKLCRGEDFISEKDKSRLRCRYNFGFHPFMKIAPIKEEEVYPKPKLVIYYDVISEEEMRVVKDFASPRFKRATVQNYKTGELETAKYRISKTAWIKREEHDYIERIYQRVGEATGLNMETSEELQVANYGMGGHYEPHFDFARREEKNAFQSLGTGNRIATWLFYMSNVEQGGATVFPQLGISLWPKKGAAVFWYNLHKNGEGDVLTRHAACPVLKGTKWVSNFWLHERGQEFTRPCSTDPFV